MKRYCRSCRTRIRRLEVRCPYCRAGTMSWMHRVIIAAFAATALFVLLKTF